MIWLHFTFNVKTVGRNHEIFGCFTAWTFAYCKFLKIDNFSNKIWFKFQFNNGFAYPNPQTETPDVQSKSFDIIGGIVSVVDQLANQARNSLDNLISQANQTATEISNNFQDFLAQSGQEFKNFTDNIQNGIETLIGDKILPYLMDIPTEFEKIRNEKSENIEKCMNDSKIRSDSINEEIAVYVNNTSDQIEAMRASVVVCIEEPDFGEKIKCAVDASRVIYSSIGKIFENIANATGTAISSFYSNSNQTLTCISSANEAGRNRTVLLLNQTRDCLANNTGWNF